MDFEAGRGALLGLPAKTARPPERNEERKGEENLAAHPLFQRDQEKPAIVKSASPTGEEFDLVIIGGGFSGLGAAYQFQAKSENKTCLIMDNHPVFGGEAKENEFKIFSLGKNILKCSTANILGIGIVSLFSS